MNQNIECSYGDGQVDNKNRLTMRAGGLGGTRREKTAVSARRFCPFRQLVPPPSH